MTSFSTALVMVGPSGVSSFHDRLWRVNPGTAQLVEGGTNGPYFLLGSGEDEFAFHIDSLDSDTITRALVLLVTLLVGEKQTIGILRSTENLIASDRGERVAPYWELADDVFESLVKRLAPLCRIGVVRLDESSIISPLVTDELRVLGLDIATFADLESARETHQE